MREKSFYEGRSVELHEKLDRARQAVAAVEQEINDNIRLVNIAPPEDDVEEAPPAPPVILKPASASTIARPATKRA